ncbi:MAG: fibronectin type III domain-containing protein, partial [Saprospiraceae bacterium]|nr:fibronectin type III domain-containing protein [Saprospiraceae bacterium]
MHTASGERDQACKEILFTGPNVACDPLEDNKNCYLCQAENYTFETIGIFPGPPDNCVDFENANWAIIPSKSRNLSINLISSRENKGIRLKVFDSQFKPLSDCHELIDIGNHFIGAGQNSSQQVKYLLYEGIDGDICTFEISDGTINLPSTSNDFIIQSKDRVTLNNHKVQVNDILFLTALSDADSWDWQIPANFEILGPTGQKELKVLCTGPGDNQICLSVTTPCFSETPLCKNIIAEYKAPKVACNDNNDNFPGCNICGLYFGSSDGYQAEQAFPGLCNAEENSQWFNFTCNTPFTEVILNVVTCTSGNGLELILFDDKGEIVEDCKIVGNNSLEIFTYNNLAPGRDYFIYIDGIDADICDFELEVINVGNNPLPAPTISAEYLSQGFYQLSTSGYPENTNFAWQIDTGVITTVNNDDTIIVFSTAGFEACLNVSNNCSFAQACKNIPPALAAFEPCGESGDDPRTCIMCGPIYLGNSGGYTPDTFAYDFPCGTVENSQWLAFHSNSTNISIIVEPSNCRMEEGLEAAIYNDRFERVSDCFASSNPTTQLVVNAENLLPGNVYYIMVDGKSGDVCDFRLIIVGGVTTGPPDPPGPVVASPEGTVYCSGDVVEYSTNQPFPIIWYDWEIPSFGEIISGQKSSSIIVKWKEPGEGKVCAFGNNFCFPGVPTCRSVKITGPEPTRFYYPSCDTSYISDEIFIAASGCDSIVRSYFGNPDVAIDVAGDQCLGDTFLLQYSGYPSPNASYTWLIEGPSATETLQGMGPFPIALADTATYTIQLILDEGGCMDTVDSKTVTIHTPPATPVVNWNATYTDINLEWNRLDGVRNYSVYLNDNIVLFHNPNNTLLLHSLEPDSSYNIRVVAHSAFGCEDSEISINCTTLSCGSSPIAFDELVVCDNADPIVLDDTYGCFWSGPGIGTDSCTLQPGQLLVGMDTISLTFSIGPCDFEEKQVVRTLESAKASADISSSVFVGGKGTISLTIDNPDGTEDILWNNGSNAYNLTDLPPGPHCVAISKGNGCITDTCFIVKPATHNVPNIVIACANKPKEIKVTPSTGIDLQWLPPTGLSCYDCPNPFVNVNGSSIYTLIGETDDGRRDTTGVFVLILPDILCGFFFFFSWSLQAQQGSSSFNYNVTFGDNYTASPLKIYYNDYFNSIWAFSSKNLQSLDRALSQYNISNDGMVTNQQVITNEAFSNIAFYKGANIFSILIADFNNPGKVGTKFSLLNIGDYILSQNYSSNRFLQPELIKINPNIVSVDGGSLFIGNVFGKSEVSIFQSLSLSTPLNLDLNGITAEDFYDVEFLSNYDMLLLVGEKNTVHPSFKLIRLNSAFEVVSVAEFPWYRENNEMYIIPFEDESTFLIYSKETINGHQGVAVTDQLEFDWFLDLDGWNNEVTKESFVKGPANTLYFVRSAQPSLNAPFKTYFHRLLDNGISFVEKEVNTTYSNGYPWRLLKDRFGNLIGASV